MPALRLREGNIRPCGTLSHDAADNGFAAARGGRIPERMVLIRDIAPHGWDSLSQPTPLLNLLPRD